MGVGFCARCRCLWYIAVAMTIFDITTHLMFGFALCDLLSGLWNSHSLNALSFNTIWGPAYKEYNTPSHRSSY